MSEKYIPKQPNKLGITVFEDIPLEILREFIDWSPFFLAWELRGKFPEILEDEKYGTEAKKLFDDANNLLNLILSQKILKAKAVVGLFPALSIGDDIELFRENLPLESLATLHFHRQQSTKTTSPNLCLADFIVPKKVYESGNMSMDYLGAFAVTTGIGIEAIVEKFEKDHDDYNAIMTKAIADRLAEAAAEWLHQKVRTEIWGYSPDEKLSGADLISEKYQGIRPAPGYPSCPDHTEKRTLFDLARAEENTGIILTENFAMYPAASVSGWYFAHPEAKYFPIGKIGKDQVADYARRKGMTIAETEKWLTPMLGY